MICSICLIEDNDFIKLKCGHNFHINCINKWLKEKFNCPLCRINIIKIYTIFDVCKDFHKLSLYDKHINGFENEFNNCKFFSSLLKHRIIKLSMKLDDIDYYKYYGGINDGVLYHITDEYNTKYRKNSMFILFTRKYIIRVYENKIKINRCINKLLK